MIMPSTKESFEAYKLLEEKSSLERARGFTKTLSFEATRIEREAEENRYGIADLPDDQFEAWATLMRTSANRILAAVDQIEGGEQS
jgi:hypothetical protein